MVQVNAIGDACPIPVIKTLHALQDLNRKTAPCQHAKFARKSLLFNYAVLP